MPPLSMKMCPETNNNKILLTIVLIKLIKSDIKNKTIANEIIIYENRVISNFQFLLEESLV